MRRDAWVRNRDVGIVLEEPALVDVEAALKSLDGNRHTLIALEGADHSLLLGGGPSAYVVVSMEKDESWTLCGDAPAEPPVSIVVGGQLGEYSGDIVVGLPAARQAAEYYLLHHGRDPALRWKTDNADDAR
jgi:hypothetical protein